MKKILLSVTIAGMVLSGCVNSTSGLTGKVQEKVQEKTVEKTTGNIMDKIGLPTPKKKTTMEKVADVASGTTTATDLAVDMVADKVADQVIKNAL